MFIATKDVDHKRGKCEKMGTGMQKLHADLELHVLTHLLLS